MRKRAYILIFTFSTGLYLLIIFDLRIDWNVGYNPRDIDGIVLNEIFVPFYSGIYAILYGISLLLWIDDNDFLMILGIECIIFSSIVFILGLPLVIQNGVQSNDIWDSIITIITSVLGIAQPVTSIVYNNSNR